AILPSRNVKQPGAWAVCGRIPVRSSQNRRHDVAAFFRRDLSGYALRPALGIEAAEPIHFNERSARKKFTCSAVENIHHAVTIRPQHRLTLPALPLDVSEDWNLSRIPVHIVVRSELVIPLQLSGVRVQSNDRICIKVVAYTPIRVVGFARVADTPKSEIGFCIIRARVHTAPPPVFQRSPAGQVSLPGSPGAGMV